jgi:hypothetical protein
VMLLDLNRSLAPRNNLTVEGNQIKTLLCSQLLL